MTTACLVTQRLGVYSPDGLDADELPEWIPISGKVKFMPNILTGHSFRITDSDGKRTSAPKSYTADIVDGVLSDNGTEGIRLFAAGPNSNPEKLSYTARYLNLTANGDPVTLRDFAFEVSPGGHVDLTDATPVAGTPAMGTTRGEPGATPYIGGNGNWWVDGKDLGVAAIKYVRSPLTASENINTLPSCLAPVPTAAVAKALGLPLEQPGELVTTWQDTSGVRRRQTFYADVTAGSDRGLYIYRRWYYNGTWRPFETAVRPSAPYYRGAVPAGVTPEDMTGDAYQGLWTYSSAQAADWGLSSTAAGVLDIISSGFSTIQTMNTLSTPIQEHKRRWYNGSWSGPWESQNNSGSGDSSSGYYRGVVPDGVTPEDMTGATYQGLWTYSSGQAAGWSIPSKAAGFIEVTSSGASTLHQATTLTTPIQNFQRRWYNGNWSGPWETIGGGTPAPTESAGSDEYDMATSADAINLLIPSVVDPTLSYEADHAALVADLKTRIGPVSTGGKAAIALVADHGTTAFKDWVWDALKARNIPFTMALAPEVHLDGKGDSRHTATNDDIKQWVSEGLAIASHSGDHDGATGYFDVSRQIVTSKKKLEEKLETTVDCWVQPGYVLANGSYDGFGTGQSASRYIDYYAGRLLQQTYPVITGYAGDSFVYPGDADLPVGVRRSLVERKDAYQGVLDYIQQAIDTGGKHVSFIHPYALVESSSTYVTRTEYLAFLDWLVQKRDAGDLVLLTLPELAISR